jgi:hypothetical protein
MGESRVRRLGRARLLEEQPICVYCGGLTKGNSVDHVPPIAVFDDRQRPTGMEFTACGECHEGTRRDDLVVALLSRMYPNVPVEAARRDFPRLVAGLVNNHPDVIAELQPVPLPSDRLINARRQVDPKAHFLQTGGPIVTRIMTRFAGRFGLAQHFQLTDRIVPPAGKVYVR